MNDSILTTTNLKKSYGDFEAVKGISFDIKRGEVFSLLGPNGAGKSTTIGMLSCLLTPTSGEASINGHSVTKNPAAVKKAIGYVPQDLALYGELNAFDNLRFWGTLYGMGGHALKQRINEVLTQVELLDRAKEKVEHYSGGMKRRLNIAVGLLHKPQLVFMDEPTVGIDPQSRRRILDMVKELQAEGMTVLYTTHYMEEAEELSDRVGIIDHGKMIAIGTQKELTKMVGENDTLRLHFDVGAPIDRLASLIGEQSGVASAFGRENEVVLTTGNSAEILPALVTIATSQQQRIRSIDIEEPNLEAVFLHLTGRALRE